MEIVLPGEGKPLLPRHSRRGNCSRMTEKKQAFPVVKPSEWPPEFPTCSNSGGGQLGLVT